MNGQAFVECRPAAGSREGDSTNACPPFAFVPFVASFLKSALSVPSVASWVGLVLLVATPAFSQGHVSGTVKDADGHPIKGATITAENPTAAPPSFTATTDAKGRFGFLGLRGGLWTFTISAPGYQTARTQATTRAAGLTAPLQIVMQLVPDVPPAGPLATLDVPALQHRLDDAAAAEADGQIDQAIDIYRDIATHLPMLTSVHLQLGLLYERKQDVPAATAEYQAVLKTDPGNTKARTALDRLARQ